jgi:GT2 family glycosyltransferase
VSPATDRASANSGLGPVSVVVCNFEGEKYLDACLGAVEKLQGVVDEVIVVDNASQDRSRAILAERHPRARVIAMQRNDGPCPARNAGLRAARNRWVLALDNDAVCASDVLLKLCAAAASAPDVAIAQPRSVFASEPSRVHYDGGSLHYAGLIALRNFYRPLGEAEGERVVDVDCAVAVALLVDRDAVLALGGWDETMFILFEDLDLSFRLRATNKRILSVEDAIVLHAGGTSGISFREGPSYPGSRVFFHSRNRWTYMAKCYRKRTLLVALPALALYEAVWFAFALTSGSIGPWWKGKRAYFGLREHVKRERARFQSERSRNDRELLVPGPLTVTPALRASGPKRALIGTLDALLALWWRIVRPLAG